MNHGHRTHGGPNQMFPVELTANTNEIRNHVRGNDDVVLHERGHGRLFKFLNHLSRTNDGLSQAGIFHVEAFKFCFFLSQQIKRSLIRLTVRILLSFCRLLFLGFFWC